MFLLAKSSVHYRFGDIIEMLAGEADIGERACIIHDFENFRQELVWQQGQRHVDQFQYESGLFV